MIYVIASIEVMPGKRANFLAEFAKIVPLVLAEDGCLAYEPTVDVETNIDAQGGVRENVATIVEKWRDIDALEQHLIAPHMIEYRGRVKSLVASAQLQILEPVE